MPKFDLQLANPLMNAAGFLGFRPEPHKQPGLERLGAFVTNPVSFKPRNPARGGRWLSFAGGFLLHTGYPNPGLSRTLRDHAAHWRRARLPVLVHLLADQPDPAAVEPAGSDAIGYEVGEIAGMCQRLEGVEGVLGIEIGLPPTADGPALLAALQALGRLAAHSELPVVARLPLDRAAGLARGLVPVREAEGSNPVEAGAGKAYPARQVTLGGLAALSLGPPRGALPGPGGELVHGRLYGPALFPQALAAVAALVATGVPVIGAGGVSGREEAQAMLEAGAIAVQLDTALWRNGLEDW